MRNWTGALVCFVDVRVNQYLVGTGPPQLTLVRTALVAVYGGQAQAMEDVLIDGGSYRGGTVPPGGIPGDERIMFIGPSFEFSYQSIQVFRSWDVQRRGGRIVAVHPSADYWLEVDANRYRSQVEISIPIMARRVQEAHQRRVEATNGRIRSGTSYPQLITDANRLYDYYVETGALNHPAGPPVLPPPPCGKAADRTNRELIQDCFGLLEARDDLRGTGMLNWNVDTAIGKWDGVTVSGTPLRVTKLELAGRSLTGTIPAALANLELTTLRLGGNTLTGCIPESLEEVPTNDLDTLDLRSCSPPAR